MSSGSYEHEYNPLATSDISSLVANFNTMNEHGPGLYLPAQPRIIRPGGDPAAVQEVINDIHDAGGQIPFGLYHDRVLYGAGGFYSQGKADIQGPLTDGPADFQTMPEMSADFSTALAVGICALHNAMGRQPFTLLELGAGSGRMMKDILASMRFGDHEAYENASVHIVDYDGMRPRQKHTLGSDAGAHIGSYAAMSTPAEHQEDLAKVRWISSSDLESTLDPEKPIIAVANEVYDALRPEVCLNRNGTLLQKSVAYHDGQFIEQWMEPTDEVQAYIRKYDIVIPPDSEVAISLEAAALQRKISRLITCGGFIGIDYGDFGSTPYVPTAWNPKPIKPSDDGFIGDWLGEGAVRTYPFGFHPLERAGELDLTHDPNFHVLEQVSTEEGMTTAFRGTQAKYMQSCGMPDRLQLEYLAQHPEISPRSTLRIALAQAVINNFFKVLVVTRGVDVDFSQPRPFLPAYRG